MDNRERTFTTWAKGPSTTEQEKCENAERVIRKALDAHEKLAEMDFTVFAQGSYRNRTNVRQDSDVDICVRGNFAFFPVYPPGKTREDFGNSPSELGFADFKQLVQDALVTYFDSDSVTRGNKAFHVHANTYRIDADVVPTFEHRRYEVKADGKYDYLSGIGFKTDSGQLIFNWPNQHYDNGLEKHEATGRRYRKMVRILKRLRNEMQDKNIAGAASIASCLIEALVWNVPNEGLNHKTYEDDVRYILAHHFNNTMKDETCSEWGEVSELKYLFRSGQPWTREQAHGFISAAWDYIGCE